MSGAEALLGEEEGAILLIEDNPGDARFIREMLREIDVVSGERDRDSAASSPGLRHADRLSDGLELLDDGVTSVVLLDLNLPDSRGLETLERVLESRGAPPVVVLTGVRDRTVGIEALERGAQGYLVKDDVTPDQLLRAIFHAVDRDRYERRLERQRDRLTALTALAQELLEGETEVAIADLVVEAAPGGLELPSTVVARYDEERGRLAAEACTPRAERVIDVETLLDSDDGEAWRAFVEGRTIRRDVTDGAGSTIQRTIVPLGRHGVLVTDVPRSAEIAAQRDFVDLLAATVRAALDRAARERALRDRDRTLGEQNERLERLNRVNDVIRDIDQALVAAASRAEIERAVCTELTTAGPYAFAWIGEYDPVDDVVEPGASSGGESGDLAALSSPGSDDASERPPTDRAVETREPQVVDDLLGDPPVPRWRRAALERGYRACIALPLTYRETLYGVLTVYSDRADAFNRLERDVLAELGETVGYAINAVESKKALVSDEYVEVEFVVRDPSLPLLSVTADLDCELELESVIARSDGGYRLFVTTHGAPSGSVLEYLNRELAPGGVHLVTEDGAECLFECTVDGSGLVGTLLDHGGVPQRFTAADGEGRVVVALPESADVRTFLGVIKSTFADAEMVARRERIRDRTTHRDFVAGLDESLTERQWEVLQTAYESGFFESPRANTGSEIGDALGVSQPTFNKHLRAAQRKLLRRVFEEE